MRINLLNLKRGTSRHALAQHLIRQAADEYQVETKQLIKQLVTGHHELGEQVAQVLRAQGWQVHWFKLAYPEPNDHLNLEPFACLSCGFVLNDACDLLIQWKLQHGSR